MQNILPFCSKVDLTLYILPIFLDKAEEFNEGLIEASISNISNEVAELLSERYGVLQTPVPGVIRRICAVASAYRVISAITTLVTSESSSDNEFLPLQKQYTESMGLLKDIAAGKIKLTLVNNRGENSTSVVTRKCDFDLRGY